MSSLFTGTDYKHISRVICETLTAAMSKPADEPELIARLVHKIAEMPLFLKPRNVAITAGGVFIHQQPKVTADCFRGSSPESVELGDLLLIRTGIEDGCVIDRRALLLQAKKVERFPARPDNKKQHQLYARWPKFRYVRSTTALNGHYRHITDADMYNAAKYLLLCEPRANSSRTALPQWISSTHRTMISAWPSEPELSHYWSFASELLDFILGYAGKSFAEAPEPEDKGWSRVIHDLLSTTANLKSKLMRRHGGTANRGVGFITGTIHPLSMLHAAGITGDHGWDIDDRSEIDASEGGMSVLEFLVDSTPPREE